MTWTAQQRRNSRDEYRRIYATGHQTRATNVRTMPEDVQRHHVHEPCPYCGTGRGMCRHRVGFLEAS